MARGLLRSSPMLALPCLALLLFSQAHDEVPFHSARLVEAPRLQPLTAFRQQAVVLSAIGGAVSTTGFLIAGFGSVALAFLPAAFSLAILGVGIGFGVGSILGAIIWGLWLHHSDIRGMSRPPLAYQPYLTAALGMVVAALPIALIAARFASGTLILVGMGVVFLSAAFFALPLLAVAAVVGIVNSRRRASGEIDIRRRASSDLATPAVGANGLVLATF